MDEILLANFMTFHDVLEAEPYDLVVGDEAWDIDYYLHENPEAKRAAFAWLTDFVGWIPMDHKAGSREARLTADYNAEMIEQIARFPRVRDASLFVGGPGDVVDVALRSRVAEDPPVDGSSLRVPRLHPALRSRRLRRPRGGAQPSGFTPDDKVVFAAVGGTAVGHHLLRRVVDAWPHARRLVPELRLIVVTGPRIDPASLPQAPGLEYRRFVPDLYAQLAGCDLAVVQGGLSTCMELTALKRPFIYFPLAHHFEQNVHVPHRLARYGAGVRMEYDRTDPKALAHAIAEQAPSGQCSTATWKPTAPAAPPPASRACYERARTNKEDFMKRLTVFTVLVAAALVAGAAFAETCLSPYVKGLRQPRRSCTCGRCPRVPAPTT